MNGVQIRKRKGRFDTHRITEKVIRRVEAEIGEIHL